MEKQLVANNHKEMQDLLKWFEKRFPDCGPEEELKFLNSVKNY